MDQQTHYAYFRPPMEAAAQPKPPELTPLFDTLGIPLAPVPTGRIHFEPPKFGPVDGPAMSLAPGLENQLLRLPQITGQIEYTAPRPRQRKREAPPTPEDREERQVYDEKKKFAMSLIKQLPMNTRKLICVSEYFKHMEQGKMRKPEAYKAAGDSAGTSAKSAMNWVDDFSARNDGTFSESKRGKHAKSPWLLQAPDLQARAVEWLKEQTADVRPDKKNSSLSRQFQQYCNNVLLIDAELPKAKKRKADDQPEEDGGADTGPRKISQKTARAWLHKLGYGSTHKAMQGDVDQEADVMPVAGLLPGVHDSLHQSTELHLVGGDHSLPDMRDPEDVPIIHNNHHPL